MEKVLPKPEPEPRSKTTFAPRPISHAHAPPDATHATPAPSTEMFDLKPIFINLKTFYGNITFK
jgi:hypothetical protein